MSLTDTLWSDVILAVVLFFGGVIMIFLPPITELFTVIGFMGMLFSLFLLCVDVGEAWEDYKEWD